MYKKLTVVDQEYIRNIYEFPAISIYVPVKLHSTLKFLALSFYSLETQ